MEIILTKIIYFLIFILIFNIFLNFRERRKVCDNIEHKIISRFLINIHTQHNLDSKNKTYNGYYFGDLDSLDPLAITNLIRYNSKGDITSDVNYNPCIIKIRKKYKNYRIKKYDNKEVFLTIKAISLDVTETKLVLYYTITIK